MSKNLEEAIDFLSYVAEVSRGWDEPNKGGVGKMKSQPNAFNAKARMYTLSSPPRVALVIHNLDLFITSKALTSQPGVGHVNHNTQLFIVSGALSFQSRVVNVIHNLKLCITSRSLSS